MTVVQGDSLALVTVTRNSAADIETLLRSATEHLPGSRVIVVDCASSDDTREVAAREGADVVVPLSENAGFGRACNRGLDEVDEPVTALINPDVEFLDASLLELVAEALRGDVPPRLLAPLVLCSDGSRQDTAHPLPGSVPEALRVVLPPRRTPGALGVALAPWRSQRPRRVGWAVGCALVARTSVFRALGPFDERIFLFGEDLDLCLHAAESGVETWFWPTARVVHHGGRSTATEFGGEPFELLARARRATVARRLGVQGRARDDAIQTLTFLTRIVGKRMLGRSAERERRQLDALSAARREDP
jgi:N-acetylglucosaminyl-diphospho-decaprenol L-rhamnosyltransferase